MWWILALLLVLGGCLGGGDAGERDTSPVKDRSEIGKIVIVSETNLTQPNEEETAGSLNDSEEEFDWGLGDVDKKDREEILKFSYDEEDPIYVRFFDVGLAESKKQGRLVQIRRGDLDIFIWSVPLETFPKAYGYIKAYSDDIEYLIIPSPREVNTESLELLFNKTEVGEVIAPHTMELPYNATYLKEGDVLEVANFTIRVWKAGDEGFHTPGDQGFILSLDSEYDRFLFLLDAETGLFRKFVADYGNAINTTYFSWNTYGGILEPNVYQLFLSMALPKYMIADGAPYKEYDAPGGSRDGIYNRVSLFGVNYTKVWEHDVVTIVISNNSYIQTS
ncbi:MAG: hypothetical protein GXN92_03305 [Candidatus Micrarchaeota archaeon]|nr:hypothetical protein [Candidatus Micrarchaeota archaeon]